VLVAVVLVTVEPPPIVVPPVYLPRGGRGVRGGLADLPLRRLPLPLAALLEPREGSLLYAMTTVDQSGRIADRSVIRSMSWQASVRLDVYEQQGLIIVRPDNRGSQAVNGRGFLAIPAAIRRWCAYRSLMLDLGSGPGGSGC